MAKMILSDYERARLNGYLINIKEFLQIKFHLKNELFYRTRERDYVTARQFFIYYAMNTFLNQDGSRMFSLHLLGGYMYRDHATVLHHLKTFDSLFTTDKLYRLDYKKTVPNLNNVVKGTSSWVFMQQENMKLSHNSNPENVKKLHQLISENFNKSDYSYFLEDKLLEESVDSTSC